MQIVVKTYVFHSHFLSHTHTTILSDSLSLSLSYTHTHTHTHTFSLSPQANDKVSVGRSEAEKLMVTTEDFEHGLQYDVKPAFGISEEQLDRYVFNGQCMLHMYIPY